MTKQELFSLKSEIFDSGLYRKVKIANKINFRQGDRAPKEALEAVYGVKAVKIATNMYNASYKRFKRVLGHIQNLATLPNVDLVFCTLTFSDEVLASTTAQTRRRYVSRWCKSVSPLYVANVDFGSKNGREHYHAIVCNIVKKEAKEAWKYGFTWFERVRSNKCHSEERVSRYITKLTSHALKESTKVGQTRVIYSKRLRVDFSQEF